MDCPLRLVEGVDLGHQRPTLSPGLFPDLCRHLFPRLQFPSLNGGSRDLSQAARIDERLDLRDLRLDGFETDSNQTAAQVFFRCG